MGLGGRAGAWGSLAAGTLLLLLSGCGGAPGGDALVNLSGGGAPVALYVDGLGGDDAGDGSAARPVATLHRALALAAADAPADVYVRETGPPGGYDETAATLEVPPGVSLHGGRGPAWDAQPGAASRLLGAAVALRYPDVAADAVLEGFEVVPSPGPLDPPGEPLTAVEVAEGAAALTLRNDRFDVGRSRPDPRPGAAARVGVTARHLARLVMTESTVRVGAPAPPPDPAAPAPPYLGAAPGGLPATGAAGADGAAEPGAGTGGRGGAAGTPTTAWGEDGRDAADLAWNGHLMRGGGGGPGGRSGQPAGGGGAGQDGPDGAPGAGGGGFGRFAGDGRFGAEPGADGASGAPGAGGGGGGGSTFATVRGGGGGGGAGGLGGPGGTGGTGGAASVGVALLDVPEAVLTDNEIDAGPGGPGGAGGDGADGQAGGPGGAGLSGGAAGGAGGRGGGGGAGGGGGGGASLGVVAGTGAAPVLSGNAITAGNGGDGGPPGRAAVPVGTGNVGGGGASYAVYDADPGDGLTPSLDGSNALGFGLPGAGGSGPRAGTAGATNF